MLTKEQAKVKLKEIVDMFSKTDKEYLNSQPEENIKNHYIEPLFEALGWTRWDMNKEQRILKGRADYILNLGNEEALVVEAKKTNVRLSEEEGSQAVSYAYHRKIKFAVLTNFKEIRVYHALSNIKNIDKNLLKFEDNTPFRFNFDQLLDNFDKLWLLSKESIEKGEINKLLSRKDEKALKPIDESILSDLLNIRDILSKDIKKLRTYLSEEQIDEAVQVLIDRLIFMRSVEDRGLEGKNFLQGLVKDYREGRVQKRLWNILQEQFKLFDKSYNSKLFAKSILEDEKNIFFDDDTLQEVIRILYNGTGNTQYRYMFDEIPGDLLGNIYEQYLGTILQSTEKRVKLDEKSGKRKKMGIYYTPSYIVDYIVKNTVGEYIKDKNIDEILEVKIVDPACGSGSFLMRAFQEVCNTIEQKLKSGEKPRNSQFQFYKDRLTLGQKASIISNCIYGVDLDEKAIELAQLNLLLKLLEEETPDTHKRLLPNLRDNIKNGNSLIDDPKIAGDKAFKWEAQFPDVFRNGGFDVVIGNPPYIRIQEMEEKDAKFLTTISKISDGYLDTYMLFTEKSINIIKNKGLFSFIMPNKFMTANYGRNLRKFILENVKIRDILDFGDLPVFESASAYPAVYIFEKGEKSSNFNYIKVKNLSEAIKGNLPFPNIIEQKNLSSSNWTLGNSENTKIISKLNDVKNKLSDVSEKIFQGLITSADDVFILIEKNGHLFSESLQRTIDVEKEILKKLVKGLEIKRYQTLNSNRFLIFPYKKKESRYSLIDEKELMTKFPRAYEYLKENSSTLKVRTDVRNNKIQWYSFSRPQNMEEFENEKIMTPFNAFSNSFTIDLESKWFFTAGVAGGYGLVLKEGINKKTLLAILNSKLVEFFIKNTSTYLRGFYYSYESRFIKDIPIKVPDKKQEKKLIDLVENILSLQKDNYKVSLSPSQKEKLEQQIKNINYEIDQEIYKLYEITKEEQKIIEESLTK